MGDPLVQRRVTLDLWRGMLWLGTTSSPTFLEADNASAYVFFSIFNCLRTPSLLKTNARCDPNVLLRIRSCGSVDQFVVISKNVSNSCNKVHM